MPQTWGRGRSGLVQDRSTVKDGPLLFNGCLDEANTQASAAPKAGT